MISGMKVFYFVLCFGLLNRNRSEDHATDKYVLHTVVAVENL